MRTQRRNVMAVRWGFLLGVAALLLGAPVAWAQAPATGAPGQTVGAGAARPADSSAELTVNGPAGAILSVDGQEYGPLPLADNLRLPAGPHRFRLERGSQRAESDVLNLPAGRYAELNLTLAGRSLVAVLTITPATLLVVTPAPDVAAQAQYHKAVFDAAKAEHAVLLGEARQAQLLRDYPGLRACLEQTDCSAPPAREGEVAYVLSVLLSEGAVSLRLLDLRTRDIGAELNSDCMGCSAAQQADRMATLAKQALQRISSRARGQLAVTSTPPGAGVTVDGRFMGQTPLSREAFTGARQVAVNLAGFDPYSATVDVEAGQIGTVHAALARSTKPAQSQPSATEQSGRPRWRVALGAGLVGAGVLIGAFGVSALAVNGSCQDASQNAETCSPYYSTTGVGAGLTATGAALAVGGAILWGLPGKR